MNKVQHKKSEEKKARSEDKAKVKKWAIAGRLVIVLSILLVLTYLWPLELISGYAELLKLIAGSLGGIASIVGFVLIFSPDEAGWKETIVRCIRENRLEVIIILLVYICYNHPDKIDYLLALIGGLGSTAAVFLALAKRKNVDKWLKKNFYKAYYIIVIALFVWSISINLFIVSGKVYFKDSNNAPVVGAKIELTKTSGLKNWPCENYSEKGKNWLVNATKLCGTKTDDKGKFFLRFIPFIKEDFQLEATDGTGIHRSKPVHFSLGEKNIKIPINRKLFEGTWECSVPEVFSFQWKIEQVGDKLTTSVIDGTPPPLEPCFTSQKVLNNRDGKLTDDKSCVIVYGLKDSKLFIKKINGRSQDNFSCYPQ